LSTQFGPWAPNSDYDGQNPLSNSPIIYSISWWFQCSFWKWKLGRK
jgi:hypothetical protein